MLGPLNRLARGVARVFRLDVEANRKRGQGCTLQGTRRRRTRVSGFRTRMKTANGRKVSRDTPSPIVVAIMKKGQQFNTKT